MRKTVRILSNSFFLQLENKKYDDISCMSCLKTQGRNDNFYIEIGYAQYASPEVECIEDQGICVIASCTMCQEILQISPLELSWSDIEWVEA